MQNTTGLYSGGGGSLYDSVNFTNDNNRLVRADGGLSYTTNDYSGNNISVCKYYDKFSGELILLTLCNMMAPIVSLRSAPGIIPAE